MVFPGSEPIQFDLEKLFLLAVSRENLIFKIKIRKNVPYKISNLFNPDLGAFQPAPGRIFHVKSDV